jgi:hypothetical protein
MTLDFPSQYGLLASHTGPDREPGINGAIMGRETLKSTVNKVNV